MQSLFRILPACCLLILTLGANAQPAPEFTGITQWLNSPPLRMEKLRGKVVLVDFWTYNCINCIHTLPYVKAWHQQYKDKGLVVIGVHTPEFDQEHKLDNLKAALKRFDLTYPIAQDNNYETWEAYNNRYWPAIYVIDKNGHMVYSHFGEGHYQQTETIIQQLLAEHTNGQAQ